MTIPGFVLPWSHLNSNASTSMCTLSRWKLCRKNWQWQHSLTFHIGCKVWTFRRVHVRSFESFLFWHFWITWMDGVLYVEILRWISFTSIEGLIISANFLSVDRQRAYKKRSLRTISILFSRNMGFLASTNEEHCHHRHVSTQQINNRVLYITYKWHCVWKLEIGDLYTNVKTPLNHNLFENANISLCYIAIYTNMAMCEMTYNVHNNKTYKEHRNLKIRKHVTTSSSGTKPFY